MLINFNNESKFFTQEQSEKLNEIARETILYFCEKIESLGNGINNQILYDMCSRIEKQLASVTFRNK
ncbi:hypothetical protein [uncultured Tyzzerella sp.]|uniref:hypothetical protein n=1 Tax=uncultured Tyzzerella sp. TaxID=2321398 RepID=UPI0029422029|nr:hypothetical protein [uncultured Tyzzerella sp.]